MAVLSLALFSLLALVLLPSLPNYRRVHVGDPAPQTYHAPAVLSFESEVLTERLRDQAAANVNDVVSFDPNIRVEQLVAFDALVQRIASVRSSPGMSASDKLAALSSTEGYNLTPQVSLLVLSFDEAEWGSTNGAARDLLSATLQNPIPAAEVDAARSALGARLTLTDSGARQVATELVTPFVVPNQVVNQSRTEEERQLARQQVVPVRVSLAKDQVIVSEGTRIDEGILESLEHAGLLKSTFEPRELAALATIAGLASLMLGWYLFLFRPAELATLRRQLVLLVLITGVVATTKVLLPALLPDEQRRYLQFALPVAAAPMLVAALLEVRLGILVAVLLAVLVTFGSAYSPVAANLSSSHPLDGLRMAMVYLLTGLAGVFSVYRAERFSRYLLAGLSVGISSWVVLASFWLLTSGSTYEELAWMTAASGLCGLLSALITLGSFIFLSTTFGITTRLQLMELAQLNFPLLRRLQDEAPGTFHHSTLISSLGERAAALIGADSLLVRVGCYYHDIGKVAQPAFYIENQLGGENPHDHLDPFTSAKIIADHVKIGVDLEKRHGVPPVVQQFTREHHGTRLVTYFYRKAAAHDPDVDPELFRYPGPRPQSRESAIVMLADSVEAMVRAAEDHSREKIGEIVDTVIGERLAEGQLDDSELTLREIKLIAESFKAGLQAVYHPRIQYPEPTPAEMRRIAAADRADERARAAPARVTETREASFETRPRAVHAPKSPDRQEDGERPEPPATSGGGATPLPERYRKRLPRG